MNRLQKKCLFASVAMHALLAAILVVGPAFLTRKQQPFNLPQINFIPTRTVDALLSGGGNPNAQPPPPAPAPVPQIVPPQPPPQPISSPPEVPRQPERKPIAPTPEPQTKPKPEPDVPPKKPGNDPTAAPAPKKSGIKVNPTPIKRQSDNTRSTKPKNPASTKPATQPDRIDAEIQRQLRSQFKSSINGMVQNLTDNLSSGTTIDIPGPGGEAFANYGQVVVAIYQQNWIKPTDVEGYHVVKTTVVIARDGRVLSSRIVGRCGIPAVDRSVSDLLDRVTFVAPFPEGAKDETRIFNIDFKLNPPGQDTG